MTFFSHKRKQVHIDNFTSGRKITPHSFQWILLFFLSFLICQVSQTVLHSSKKAKYKSFSPLYWWADTLVRFSFSLYEESRFPANVLYPVIILDLIHFLKQSFPQILRCFQFSVTYYSYEIQFSSPKCFLICFMIKRQKGGKCIL